MKTRIIIANITDIDGQTVAISTKPSDPGPPAIRIETNPDDHYGTVVRLSKTQAAELVSCIQAWICTQ